MKDAIVFVNFCIIFLVLLPIFLLIGIFGKKKQFLHISLITFGLAVLSFLLVIIFADVPTPNLFL